jgi:lipooligosaccharide transport system ATP-binding protein
MDKGKIVGEGSPRLLIEQHSRPEVVELRFPVGVLEEIADRLDGLAPRVEVLADRALLYTDDADATVEKTHAEGLDPETVLVRRSTLEDVFLKLTGRTLED